MEAKIRELIEQVDARQSELLELVKTLITFKTPAPPARNTEEAQDYIASFLRESGFEIDMWEVYSGDPNVVGVLKGEAAQQYQSLIINGHIDVAEIGEDEQWRSEERRVGKGWRGGGGRE